MDVHYGLGAKGVADVARWHERDRAAAGERGVRFICYWFDERRQRLFCLCEAPEPGALADCHRAAHGNVPDEIIEVQEFSAPEIQHEAGRPLVLDSHQSVKGIKPERIADAIRRHTAVGAAHGVRWLKAWYDEDSGRLFCLSEAPSAEAHIAVHKEAAGMLVDEIAEVTEGPS